MTVNFSFKLKYNKHTLSICKTITTEMLVANLAFVRNHISVTFVEYAQIQFNQAVSKIDLTKNGNISLRISRFNLFNPANAMRQQGFSHRFGSKRNGVVTLSYFLF